MRAGAAVREPRQCICPIPAAHLYPVARLTTWPWPRSSAPSSLRRSPGREEQSSVLVQPPRRRWAGSRRRSPTATGGLFRPRNLRRSPVASWNHSAIGPLCSNVRDARAEGSRTTTRSKRSLTATSRHTGRCFAESGGATLAGRHPSCAGYAACDGLLSSASCPRTCRSCSRRWVRLRPLSLCRRRFAIIPPGTNVLGAGMAARRERRRVARSAGTAVRRVVAGHLVPRR